MTVRELLNRKKGSYTDWEMYGALKDNNFEFHTDSIRSIRNDLDAEVKAYEIMNEDRYDKTILANAMECANFKQWYDDKNARILVIAI